MSGFIGGSFTRRVSRRAAVRGGVMGMGGLAAAFAIACGGGSNNKSNTSSGNASPAATSGGKAAATTAPEQQPKVGGDYRVGFTGPFAGVDPHNSVYGGSGIVPLVYN